MPRTHSLKWSELKIGIMAVVAIFLAASLILALSGQSGLWWQRYYLKARFANASGVNKGSIVRVSGVKVGSVSDLEFAGSQIEMTLVLRKDMRPLVRTTSRATIGSVSLLGEGAVDISASNTGSPIPDWGYVITAPPAPALSDVTTQASIGIGDLNAVLHDLRDGKGTVGKLMTDEQLYAELRQFTAAARDVTQNLQRGKGTLGQLLTNPESANQLQASLKNLTAITDKINKGQGSLGQLMNDPAFAKSLSGATANFESLSAKLNQGQGSAGKLVNDSALYDRLNAVTTQLEQLTTKLNQGQGTMGQLMQDQALYDNMNRTVTELHDLVADIRKDPKKFLSAKISIF
ncbi:MAG TPA: MlaD family protein [Vicinamibacterales bacterium]|jgi:phospholipid/cholesterol/gamma-HCH transport system substrate-binding protein|nr:MlaD family protein [Vicinamibacterales bacterium]